MIHLCSIVYTPGCTPVPRTHHPSPAHRGHLGPAERAAAPRRARYELRRLQSAFGNWSDKLPDYSDASTTTQYGAPMGALGLPTPLCGLYCDLCVWCCTHYNLHYTPKGISTTLSNDELRQNVNRGPYSEYIKVSLLVTILCEACCNLS